MTSTYSDRIKAAREYARKMMTYSHVGEHNFVVIYEAYLQGRKDEEKYGKQKVHSKVLGKRKDDGAEM